MSVVRHSKRLVQGFAVHTLASPGLSIAMVPELGGRIVSLRDRDSGREWLDGWAPASKRRIWQPADPLDFASGPGAGIDECLPTVLPCRLGRKPLPDHGELWNRPAEFEVADATTFTCRWRLKSLPLAFERRISLDGRRVRLDYRLENLGTGATPFLWAWHPLFSWKAGDRIQAPAEVRTCMNVGGSETMDWPQPEIGTDLSRAIFAPGATPAAKVFLGPLSQGRMEIHSKRGDHLTLDWPSRLFPFAGIWITRGFWKGLHHWAIEPTNAPVDCLSEVQPPSTTSLLAPGEVREWALVISVQSESSPPLVSARHLAIHGELSHG